MKPLGETRVVIVGGGFGGLAAAKALRGEPVQVTLIDRNNHHLFQPLLYQVATSVLAPGNIAFPIRGILRNQRNARVLMGEVTGVDKERRLIRLAVAGREDVELPYDILILALGMRTNYFGRADFEKFTVGLKTAADAVALRNRILRSFEQAEAVEVAALQRELLTFVVVGGGPTGVEMAAAIAVFVRTTLRTDFRRVDPASARIVLVDVGHRVLGSFAEPLSEAAAKRLTALGVEVRLGKGVDAIDESGVVLAGEVIASKTVVWAAGVAASPAGKWLEAATDHAGAVRIHADLTVPGYEEIFVIGDTASLDQDGRSLPGVAQVAIQQGRYAGKLIAARAKGRPALPPFRYFDKGNMAVVGKGFAVLQAGRLHLSGAGAWLIWGAIHLQFLATNGLRLNVLVQWLWTLVTAQRGSRIIVRHRAEPMP
jgi:NADH dehydrogenase FAD-containing subunit